MATWRNESDYSAIKKFGMRTVKSLTIPISIFVFFLLFGITCAAQVSPDSLANALAFYPMHNGNYWEYTVYGYTPDGNNTSSFSWEITGDTVVPNGRRYKQFLRKNIPDNMGRGYKFERIDSITGSVYRWEQNSGFINNEYQIDSLVAAIHGRFAGSWTWHGGSTTMSCKIIGIIQDSILGRPSFSRVVEDQNMFPRIPHYITKGFGYTYEYFSELGTIVVTRLSFARINGAEYGTRITGIKENPPMMDFSLSQNYPNPFNPGTRIEYGVGSKEYGAGKDEFVTLKVFDVLGKEVATLVNEEKPAGSYEVEFNGAGLPGGVYVYRLTARGYTETKKMVLLR